MGIAVTREYGWWLATPGFLWWRDTRMSRIWPSRFRSTSRSRYIHSTASISAGPIVASVSSCRGDSTTSSLAPRGLIMSNMPTPSRTSSHSIRKYASGSGTTRMVHPGPFAVEPSGRYAAISGPVRCSAPGQYAQSVCRGGFAFGRRSEEHTSELQSRSDLVCRLLLEKKKKKVNRLLDYKKKKKKKHDKKKI